MIIIIINTLLWTYNSIIPLLKIIKVGLPGEYWFIIVPTCSWKDYDKHLEREIVAEIDRLLFG